MSLYEQSYFLWLEIFHDMSWQRSHLVMKWPNSLYNTLYMALYEHSYFLWLEIFHDMSWQRKSFHDKSHIFIWNDQTHFTVGAAKKRTPFLKGCNFVREGEKFWFFLLLSLPSHLGLNSPYWASSNFFRFSFYGQLCTPGLIY